MINPPKTREEAEKRQEIANIEASMEEVAKL